MNIYPIPSSLKVENGRFILKEGAGLYADPIAQKPAALLQKRLLEQYGVSVSAANDKNSDILFLEEPGEKESYRIQVSEDKIEIGASDYKGFICYAK